MADKLKKNPSDMFLEISRKCNKLGITSSELNELPSIKKLRRKNSRHGLLFWLILISVAAIALAFGSQAVFRTFARAYFAVRGYDVEEELCLFNMPAEVQNMFMPPVDCSMCRNLTIVERVRNISPTDFELRFAYSLVPVVVADGTLNWTAVDVFSFEFFRDLYMGSGEDIETDGEWEKECQFFPYQTEFHSLKEVLSMSEERAARPWYIGWSNCDSKVGNILRKHYRRPYFLPLLSESTNIDWIFMGTPGHGAHMHIDHVHNPSWQAQIKGRKEWTLEPVPECYNECKSLKTIVEPGEVIVLDTNRWYHKTKIIGNDLSITIGSEFD
ncbi:uncharacterized protein LOC129226036 [Uloborus diversus]|uniref:uncharacterized protein LOC129226036 n=1 Tax=Uloborus diversus TaxID=327109 RepID=UPI00240994D3|nr:uncharacterized protein LOC129226036 [Uloborus diversus]